MLVPGFWVQPDEWKPKRGRVIPHEPLRDAGCCSIWVVIQLTMRSTPDSAVNAGTHNPRPLTWRESMVRLLQGHESSLPTLESGSAVGPETLEALPSLNVSLTEISL